MLAGAPVGDEWREGGRSAERSSRLVRRKTSVEVIVSISLGLTATNCVYSRLD